MIRDFASDERGMLDIDWVAVTAGALLCGLIAVYAVTTYSTSRPALSLLDQFTDANQQFEQDGQDTVRVSGARGAVSFTK